MTEKTKLKSKMQTYRLTTHALNAIDKMSQRFTEVAQTKISKAKVIELAIFYCEKKSLEQLLKITK